TQQLAAGRQRLLPLDALIRRQTVFGDDLEVFAEQNFCGGLQRLRARGRRDGVVVSEQPLFGGFDSTLYISCHIFDDVHRISGDRQDPLFDLFDRDPLKIVIVHRHHHLHVVEQQGERRIGLPENLFEVAERPDEPVQFEVERVLQYGGGGGLSRDRFREE